ncbi:MAG TPA: FTR1 family protein [Acidimicrobiales bacterium]|jgi:high-affinity iron transporter
MIPTFVIFLREGIEGSMIVAILLSYLDQIGERRRFRDVFIGIAASFGLILAGGVGAYYLIDHYNGSNVQAYFETITYLIAAAVLTAMTFWMSRHARTMSSELRGRSDVALSKGSRFGVGILAFQAVGREGLETMVFTLAIIFASSHQGPAPHGKLLLVGAVAGLAVASAISVAIYRLGAKLNYKIFFRVMGIALMVFAAGLLANAVENLQQLGWLPFGRHVLWNTSGAITQSSNLGDVLHSFFGYADHPTILQGIVWIVYLGVCVGLFVSIGKVRPKRHAQRVA